MMDIPKITQRGLWERQHATRGATLECSDTLRFTPNDTAIKFEQNLLKVSRILEIGSANGRDARYWASLGHSVIAADFSVTALKQLREIAIGQGVMNSILPVVWDINTGHLPINTGIQIDAFYARSALHIDDTVMMSVAKDIDNALISGGIILIEGKGPNDEKISRSDKMERGIAVDNHEGGHIRRIWTKEFTEKMCSELNWNILDLTDSREEWQGVPASFMRVVARKGN